MAENRALRDQAIQDLLRSIRAPSDAIDDALSQPQDLDETPASNLFDAMWIERLKAVNAQLFGLNGLAQPVGRTWMSPEIPTDTQQGLGAVPEERVSEPDQVVRTSEDPFFQHFQKLAAEQGPSVPARSRFFPSANAGEASPTAPSVQGAVEDSECLDEPCELALSDCDYEADYEADDEMMKKRKRTNRNSKRARATRDRC